MHKRKLSHKEMVAKSKNKVLACSTPEHRLDSPSRDSDSICDSDAGSPVPFLCTQDGAEGETDVVWNFYTPKAEHATSRSKNTTPVSRKARKTLRPKLIDKPAPKRRTVKPTQKRTELFQDLLELNQNLHELINKKAKSIIEMPSVTQSGNEEDILSDTSGSSPKSGLKTTSRCLRKNVLSSKFKKQEQESGLESDDSMNECLLRASQVVEENIIDYDHSVAKRPCLEGLKSRNKSLKLEVNGNIDQDSMDSILSNIRLESPSLNKTKKCASPRLNNDSFDNLLGNLNDSALEILSQMPIKDNKKNITSTKESDWVLQDIVIHGESPSSKSIFGRHNSMPESPSVKEINKPSTSGMAFGRYNSMPFNKSDEKIMVPDESPIKCSQYEIKKKHQQARERLMAKRLLPFTATQQRSQELLQQPVAKKCVFQPKVASIKTGMPENNNKVSDTIETKCCHIQNPSTEATDVKTLIEKKRQEALMKLRRRMPHQKLS